MAVIKIKNPFGLDSGAWWIGVSADAKPTPSTFNASFFADGAYFYELDTGVWHAWDADSWEIAAGMFGVGGSGLSAATFQVATELVLDTNAVSLAVSTTAAQTALNIPSGRYYLSTDVDVFVKNHAIANDVTTSAYHFMLSSGMTMGPFVFSGATKLGGITAAGAGLIRIMKSG